MCRQRGAGGLAVARQDIDDAGGEAGLQYQLGEAQRAERRLLGRLQHDRAARPPMRAPVSTPPSAAGSSTGMI